MISIDRVKKFNMKVNSTFMERGHLILLTGAQWADIMAALLEYNLDKGTPSFNQAFENLFNQLEETHELGM